MRSELTGRCNTCGSELHTESDCWVTGDDPTDPEFVAVASSVELDTHLTAQAHASATIAEIQMALGLGQFCEALSLIDVLSVALLELSTSPISGADA